VPCVRAWLYGVHLPLQPNDTVVWVDLLSEAEFAAGFGSSTPMLIGQTRVRTSHVTCCLCRTRGGHAQQTPKLNFSVRQLVGSGS
jgi:hypothetical protein